jgi:hypothetical protein
MGIARSEIRHMIEHMAKLMVQEADSWANTYGPEARLCPTCGHPTMGAIRDRRTATHKCTRICNNGRCSTMVSFWHVMPPLPLASTGA